MIDIKDSDICIIGAGIGGLTAGALLTKKGYKVTIFEKEAIMGGRALSFSDLKSLNYNSYRELLSSFNLYIPFSEPDLKTIFEKILIKGHKLDLGYHAIGGGVFSNLNGVLSEINDHIDILESNVGLIKDHGFDYPFLTRTDKIKISPNIIRLILSGEKTMKKLDPISMTETIRKYGKGKMKLILEIFSRSITTVNNLDRISTGEMFRSLKNLYRGSKPVGYPINGLSSVHNKLANYITKNGGKIYLNSNVEEILINKNKAKGVIVGDKTYNFNTIISNILIQDIFKVLDEKYFPKEYVQNIKSLTGTGSLCAYYSLEKIDPNLLGKTFHFIEKNVGVDGRDAVGMIDFMAALPESGLSSSSNHLIQSYIICTPEEAKDEKMLKTLRELLDKNLEKLIPNFRSHIRWIIYPAVWHLDGVAKTIDNKKIEIKSPIENLFFIGDCVKAPGIGFNCAINSAKILSESLPPLI